MTRIMAERKINLNDRKYDALKRVLAAQGRDIDEEIVARIEALYEDLVPKPEREQIAQALKSEYPEGSFAVYRFKDEGESMYFTSSKVMTLYASAKLYGKIEADGNRVLTLDSIVHRYFGEDGTEIISENIFSVLAKAMANDERITTVVEYNFDSECIKVHDRDGVTVKHYTLDTLMDCFDDAEIALVHGESERDKTLARLMNGKEYLTEPIPSKEYLAARLIVCKAASKVVNEDMNCMDCRYTDPLSDVLYEEQKKLSAVVGTEVLHDADIISPYLKPLLNEYTDKLWANGFPKHYGWDKESVIRGIAKAIEPQEIKARAETIVDDALENTIEEEQPITVFSLMRCGLEDVHLVDKDEEHELATIVELNQNTLTEQGKRDWADVLGAKVDRIFEGGYGVQISVSGCDPQRLAEFSFMLAGYVSNSQYDRWVNQSHEEGENDAIQRL